jgi:hypothetical protein
MCPDKNPAISSCAKRTRPGKAAFAHDWQSGLPTAWRTQVVRPVFFSTQREYEIDAIRIVGHETEDQPCYCHYHAVITALRCDEDDVWFVTPVYGEELTGWRLIDDRWLIRRQIFHGEDCQASQSFFSFSGEMPR